MEILGEIHLFFLFLCDVQIVSVSAGGNCIQQLLRFLFLIIISASHLLIDITLTLQCRELSCIEEAFATLINGIPLRDIPFLFTFISDGELIQEILNLRFVLNDL